ncbi:MAG: cupredoxin domain-containing protein, partial [Acidobacteria bacterium]|nr:cupredoxin domain-containing protein [Acidobacteriota bacterium]
MMQKTTLTQRGAGLNLAVPLAIVSFAALVLAGAAVSSFAQQADAQEAEPLLIEVTLDEYSFSPEPLRIPAGREVTLVIRNVGEFAHEFMAGRDPEGNDFKQDLFAGLHVNIEKVDTTEAGHADHNEDAGHDADAGHDERAEHNEGAGHDADAGHDERAEHNEGAGHDADAGHDERAEHNEGAGHDADAGHDERAEHNEGAGHDADAGHDEHAEQSADAQEHAHDAEHAHGTMVEAQA